MSFKVGCRGSLIFSTLELGPIQGDSPSEGKLIPGRLSDYFYSWPYSNWKLSAEIVLW